MTSATARMVLTPQEIGRYLLRRGLTDPASIVEGDLQIIDTSRRNCNLVVATERGPSYLLKQGLEDRTAVTVGHEALIYRILGRLPDDEPLTRFVLRCHGYDDATGVLALELLPKATTLREHALRRRRCSLRLARSLGTALAALHRPTVARLGAQTDGLLRGERPWALSVYQPSMDAFRQASGAAIHLFQVIQRYPTLRDTLDDLRRTWQPSALIHGDLRWENCLVHARRTAERTDFKLIDWEFADLGEPGWDIASVFTEYLSCWIQSVPITGRCSPGEFLSLATFPLDRIQPAVRAFWGAYVKHARLARADAQRLALRAVRFCGARLLQSAFEHVSGAIDLDAYAVAVLQLGHNILDRPVDAGLHVLGLPTFSGVAR
jgi:hypothetical protein